MKKFVRCVVCKGRAREVAHRQVDTSTYKVGRVGARWKKWRKIKGPSVYRSVWKCLNSACKAETVFEGRSKARVRQLLRSRLVKAVA